MKPIVDKETCIGCGTCIALANKTFKFDGDGKAEVTDPHGDDVANVKLATDSCPVQAITLVEE